MKYNCQEIDAAAMGDTDRKYMRRALVLAASGRGEVSPNPMVGAVIVAQGRIIGEGWHRRFGGAHAEVNALASVKESDRRLIPESTIYVTLEPCSHYGKTPPCAEMIVRERFRKVVVAMEDPNEKVSGRGISMIRDAGIPVDVGLMAKEAEQLNIRFITAHRERRPYVQLKWARSADGFIAALQPAGAPKPVAFSTPLSKVMMHRERAVADAILVGKGTLIADNPELSLRLWPGKEPRKVVLVSGDINDTGLRLMSDDNTIKIGEYMPPAELCAMLYAEYGISSLMVEGGAEVLGEFIDAGMWDEIRRETAPITLGVGLREPSMPPCEIAQGCFIGRNLLEVFRPI